MNYIHQKTPKMVQEDVSSDELPGKSANGYEMDDSTVNKLIPQMFDQMRSNLGIKAGDQGDGDGHHQKFTAQGSSINTQSLLKELGSLDKIIPIIEAIDSSLQKAVPSHLNRLHEICKSTNAMLESWVTIQSHAGYVHNLMDSEKYLKYCDTQLKAGEPVAAETVIAEEMKEIQSLKQQIAQEQNKTVNRDQKPSAEGSATGNRPVSAKKVTKNRPYMNSRIQRPSAIPSVTSRLARPTASSSRKMFR